LDFGATLGSGVDLDAQKTLERVYEHLPVMMYASNAKGAIVDVNKFWLKRLGYEKRQVIGRSSVDFMATVDPETRIRVWGQLSRGEDVNAWSVQFRCANGEVMDGLLYGAPIMSARGELQGAIATVFDVTELRIAQRARDQLEQELRLSQKLEAIGQLAAGIAHEINTPSQYVSDNLSFLHEAITELMPVLDVLNPLLELCGDEHNPKLADYRARVDAADLDYVRQELPLAIQQSRDGVAQIKKIVVAMKEFSHPGADEKEPLDLNRAIEATSTVARNEWKYVAELELDLDETLPQIEAVPSAINQVILNLVVNAAHAIGDVVGPNNTTRGTIKIATRRDGPDVEMTIADTGCGIPPEHLERIFDPFFTTKKLGKGTGQGLAIARRMVVDRHGGSIDVTSERNKGTTFRVRLPISAPAVAEAGTG
jgi:two-component system, NtrC family, sensor kinase